MDQKGDEADFMFTMAIGRKGDDDDDDVDGDDIMDDDEEN